MKKFDYILLFGTIGFALILLLLGNLVSTKGAYVIISVDGTEQKRYALTEEIEEDIQGLEEGHVHLVIHNGVADVTDASCPDQLCVSQTKVSKAGETIVCLPNRIVIKVVSDEEAPLDAVTN